MRTLPLRVYDPRLFEIFNDIIVLGLIGLVPITPRSRGGAGRMKTASHYSNRP